MKTRRPYWRCTLTNKHAGCAYVGEGRTRDDALRDALNKCAGGEFLTYGPRTNTGFPSTRLMLPCGWPVNGHNACKVALRTAERTLHNNVYTWTHASGVSVTLRRMGGDPMSGKNYTKVTVR